MLLRFLHRSKAEVIGSGRGVSLETFSLHHHRQKLSGLIVINCNNANITLRKIYNGKRDGGLGLSRAKISFPVESRLLLSNFFFMASA